MCRRCIKESKLPVHSTVHIVDGVEKCGNLKRQKNRYSDSDNKAGVSTSLVIRKASEINTKLANKTTVVFEEGDSSLFVVLQQVFYF